MNSNIKLPVIYSFEWNIRNSYQHSITREYSIPTANVKQINYLKNELCWKCFILKHQIEINSNLKIHAIYSFEGNIRNSY